MLTLELLLLASDDDNLGGAWEELGAGGFVIEGWGVERVSVDDCDDEEAEDGLAVEGL